MTYVKLLGLLESAVVHPSVTLPRTRRIDLLLVEKPANAARRAEEDRMEEIALTAAADSLRGIRGVIFARRGFAPLTRFRRIIGRRREDVERERDGIFTEGEGRLGELALLGSDRDMDGMLRDGRSGDAARAGEEAADRTSERGEGEGEDLGRLCGAIGERTQIDGERNVVVETRAFTGPVGVEVGGTRVGRGVEIEILEMILQRVIAHDAVRIGAIAPDDAAVRRQCEEACCSGSGDSGRLGCPGVAVGRGEAQTEVVFGRLLERAGEREAVARPGAGREPVSFKRREGSQTRPAPGGEEAQSKDEGFS